MARLNNTVLWNEAAKAGVLFGLVSVSCLVLKELAGMSGSAFLVQAAAVILWTAELFGGMKEEAREAFLAMFEADREKSLVGLTSHQTKGTP